MSKLQSQNSRNYISNEQYILLKNEARWDIAWQIFDDVNKKVQDRKQYFRWPVLDEIDLNCLDQQEALAICK